MKLRLAIILLAGVASAASAQSGAPVRLPSSVYVDAWEASLALEATGDLIGAKRAITAVFGERPTAYDPCLRLAWLSSQVGDIDDAIVHYRCARERPGSPWAATEGLSFALSRRAYSALSRGALGEARGTWEEAERLDPENSGAKAGLGLIGRSDALRADLWAGAISATPGSSSAQIYYAQVAWQATPTLAVRGAARQVAGATPLDSTAAFASQSEAFIGIAKDIGIANIEGLAFIVNAIRSTIGGGAAVVRLGGTWGLTTTASYMRRPGGNNVQLAPMAFAYVGSHLSIAAGARFTSDSAFSAVSPIVSLGAEAGRVRLDIVGHTGREQWAFQSAGPTILSFLYATKNGATATLQFRATDALRVALQAQQEALNVGGTFRSFSLGATVPLPR